MYRAKSRFGMLLSCTMVAALVFSALPSVPRAQEVRTLSAGIAQEGRVPQPGYSVRFEFAELTGAYLAEVSVLVKDAAGKTMIDMVSKGPWLFADLAPGDYTIMATAKNGKKQAAVFSVQPGPQRAVRLAWR